VAMLIYRECLTPRSNTVALSKPMRFNLPEETSYLSTCMPAPWADLSPPGNWRRFNQSHLVPGERCCE